MLLPGIDVEGGLKAGERLRTSIEEAEVKGLERITASIGVATFLRHTENLSELLELADQAMYRAKKNGRNRVELAKREEEDNWQKLIINTFTEVLEKYNPSMASEVLNQLNTTEKESFDLFNVLYRILKTISLKYNNVFSLEYLDEKIQVITEVSKKCNISEEEIEKLKIASMLNDIGALLTAEDLILKPGPLTKEEKKRASMSSPHRWSPVLRGSGTPRACRGSAPPRRPSPRLPGESAHCTPDRSDRRVRTLH